MKKTLLFTTKNLTFYSLLVCFLCINYGWSQTELVLNGTADDFNVTATTTGPPPTTQNTNDNSDAWNMIPPTEVIDNTGATVASPYNALWNNTVLYTYLKDTYNTGSDVDQAPGSTSDGTYSGTTKTRGVKLFGDGSPVVSQSTRRLYQKIVVEVGAEYTFKIDSRSEFANIPSEVFILNEEITTEVGLENKGADTRVDAYMEITNDFNSSTGSSSNNTFTTSTFDFTATTTTVVIYVRALLANSGTTEVFFDNISLVKKATASVKDVLASKLNIYPNPANDYITIKSNSVKLSSVELYNVLGARVLSAKTLNNDRLNVSGVSKGIYMLKVNAEGASSTKKIVIE